MNAKITPTGGLQLNLHNCQQKPSEHNTLVNCNGRLCLHTKWNSANYGGENDFLER